jgi:hypothetical protein
MMNDASKATEQTVKIGRNEYKVEATGKETVAYILRGPRGGIIEGIRNKKSGAVFLLQGARELPYFLTDASGTVEVHAK